MELKKQILATYKVFGQAALAPLTALTIKAVYEVFH